MISNISLFINEMSSNSDPYCPRVQKIAPQRGHFLLRGEKGSIFILPVGDLKDFSLSKMEKYLATW